MEKMKELYEKVAKDSALKAKFAEIMKESSVEAEEETRKKLEAFAKEAGFDVTWEDMQEFVMNLAEKKEGELSDTELDAVAGGKSARGVINIIRSVISVGITCAEASLATILPSNTEGIRCEDYFK